MTIHPIGGMWENAAWEVQENVPCHYSGDDGESSVPCKHCGPLIPEDYTMSDGITFTMQHFICPRVVVGTNEGGCNTTGICLDCILEAYK